MKLAYSTSLIGFIRAMKYLILLTLVISKVAFAGHHSIGVSLGPHNTYITNPSSLEKTNISGILGNAKLSYAYQTDKFTEFSFNFNLLGDSVLFRNSTSTSSIAELQANIGQKIFISEHIYIYPGIGLSWNEISATNESTKEAIHEWGGNYQLGIGYETSFGLGIRPEFRQTKSKHIDSKMFSVFIYYAF